MYFHCLFVVVDGNNDEGDGDDDGAKISV